MPACALCLCPVLAPPPPCAAPLPQICLQAVGLCELRCNLAATELASSLLDRQPGSRALWLKHQSLQTRARAEASGRGLAAAQGSAGQHLAGAYHQDRAVEGVERANDA